MILAWLHEAVTAGVREEKACEVLGLSVRTVQRWKLAPDGEDGRHGPHTRPSHALTDAEEASVLTALHQPEFHDASPKTLVARLADRGEYLASESTMYRLLRAEGELTHRGRAKAPEPRETPSHRATGPNQVWSWDITYLLSPVCGVFFYLYLIVDIWSRRIMGWAVHLTESQGHAAALLDAAAKAADVDPGTLVLHSDNGGPMRGGTMLAKMRALGIQPSFSRPRVSDDNPFSEALFRTLKYLPSYPHAPFADLAAARRWVEQFVAWYNGTHLHSGIGWVTPTQRHVGTDVAILASRRAVYEAARAAHPARWSGSARTWNRPGDVTLNAKEHQNRTARPTTPRSTASASAAREPAGGSIHKGGRRGPKTGPGGSPSQPVTPATPRYSALLEDPADDSK